MAQIPKSRAHVKALEMIVSGGNLKTDTLQTECHHHSSCAGRYRPDGRNLCQLPSLHRHHQGNHCTQTLFYFIPKSNCYPTRWSSAWSRSPITCRSANFTTCSARFSGGTAIWATSFVYTVRKLVASGGRRGRKRFTSSSCTGRRSSSASATPCTCGSGTFASWIFRRGSKVTTRRSVWVAAALRPRSFAEVQPATV